MANNETLEERMNTPPASIPDPQNTEQFYTESFSEVLVQSIGYYVVCEFLIGTSNIVVKEGILYAAGMNFLTLRDEQSTQFTVCDLYSLKFVTVYDSTTRPPQLNNNGRTYQNGRTHSR